MKGISLAQRELWEVESGAISAAQRRALADFRRHVMADLPDPADYARWLPARAVEAMLRARSGPDGWYLLAEDARIVIRYGLCEAGTTLQFHFIGGFGLKVLRELRRKDA